MRTDNLRQYVVTRPYCSPGRVLVLARSTEEAIWLSVRAYGSAGAEQAICYDDAHGVKQETVDVDSE